jgi:ferredoxin-nitrite reductase
VQCSAVSAPSSSSASPPAAGAVPAERLEPRVEQREGGYWVLKEKYRTGLNPQEKVKLGKEPMALFTEGGIKDLAKLPMEEIDAEKLTKEDVDVRLKWLGLFHRRKQQCMSLCPPPHPTTQTKSLMHLCFTNILVPHLFLFLIHVRAR